nr:hypothetical protein [Tessaracoccus antarcticus]
MMPARDQICGVESPSGGGSTLIVLAGGESAGGVVDVAGAAGADSLMVRVTLLSVPGLDGGGALVVTGAAELLDGGAVEGDGAGVPVEDGEPLADGSGESLGVGVGEAGSVDADGEGDGLADAHGLCEGVGAWEGLTDGLLHGLGDPVTLGEALGLGLVDAEGEGEAESDGAPLGLGEFDGLGEGDAVRVGDTGSVEDGVPGLVEPDMTAWPVPMPWVSTTTALPFSHGSGLVNWPSAMTSKCRWHPVEKPVVPTRPTPWCVSTF